MACVLLVKWWSSTIVVSVIDIVSIYRWICNNIYRCCLWHCTLIILHNFEEKHHHFGRNRTRFEQMQEVKEIRAIRLPAYPLCIHDHFSVCRPSPRTHNSVLDLFVRQFTPFPLFYCTEWNRRFTPVSGIVVQRHTRRLWYLSVCLFVAWLLLDTINETTYNVTLHMDCLIDRSWAPFESIGLFCRLSCCTIYTETYWAELYRYQKKVPFVYAHYIPNGNVSNTFRKLNGKIRRQFILVTILPKLPIVIANICNDNGVISSIRIANEIAIHMFELFAVR